MRRPRKTLLAFGVLTTLLTAPAARGDGAFEQALELASEERYREAGEVLVPLLAREPGHPRARLLDGILRARAGELNDAAAAFEALRRDRPDMPEPYNNLAVVRVLQGRLDDARTILLTLLQRRPDAVAYANLGDVYTALARNAYREARRIELDGETRPEPAMDTAFTLPQTPAVSTGTELARHAFQDARRIEHDGGNYPEPATDTAFTAPRPPAASTGTELARHAFREVRRIEPNDGTHPESATDTAFTPPQTPAVSSGTELARHAFREVRRIEHDDGTHPEPATDTAFTLPQIPAASSGAEPDKRSPNREEDRDEMPAQEDQGEVRTGEDRSDVRTPASEAASTPASFCAHAEGFADHRSIADAALWLRSHGVEIVEVRHEKRQVVGHYRVFLPPEASREAAVEKLREIRQWGIRDVAVIDEGALANGISFGVFRNADNMHRRVAALDRNGYPVRSAPEEVKVVEDHVIRVRAAGAPATLVAAWTARFPGHSMRVVDCV